MQMAPSFHHFDELHVWIDRQQMLECTSAVVETADVMTFTFRAEKPAWFRYLPGQFVTLELPVADEPVMRTYTLSSTPSRPLSIAVTVKAQADSIGTRWMFDHLKPGMKLRAFGPLGDFSFVRHPGDKYLFISAGSGVTPMMSMIAVMAHSEGGRDGALLEHRAGKGKRLVGRLGAPPVEGFRRPISQAASHGEP